MFTHKEEWIMICSVESLKEIGLLIDKLKEKTFDINTQYKFIKLSKVIKEESQYAVEQELLLFNVYGERDEKGQFIANEQGGVKIKQDCLAECLEKLTQLSKRTVQLPDLYFSIDELQELGLTLGELEVLEPFIK